MKTVIDQSYRLYVGLLRGSNEFIMRIRMTFFLLSTIMFAYNILITGAKNGNMFTIDVEWGPLFV